MGAKSMRAYAAAIFVAALAGFCAADAAATRVAGPGWWTWAIPCLSFPASLGVWRATRRA